MNRLKNFVEWNAFGVCSSIGDRLHISPCRIRQYFIYSSVLTMGSPIIVYMVLAFWKNMKTIFIHPSVIPGIIYNKTVCLLLYGSRDRLVSACLPKPQLKAGTVSYTALYLDIAVVPYHKLP